jgi:GTP pyrophosphokinase
VSPKKETLLKKMMTRVSKKARPDIRVKDSDGTVLTLAKCCSPIKGEPIIGYITSGKGITVHSLRCALVSKEILDSRRMVEVSWDKSMEGPFKASLLIKAVDTPGVLAQLTSDIAQTGGNITKAEVSTSSDKKAQIKLTLAIRDIDHLENIMKKISGIKEISSVTRG